MNSPFDGLDARTLRLNLVLTQALLMVIAAVSSLWLHGWKGTLALFAAPSWRPLCFAAAVAGGVMIVNTLLDRLLPRHWLDDSGLNQRLFAGLSPTPALLICLLVGISEEWLFRGVLQTVIGNLWTSLVFTLLHVRYWRRPLLCAVVFGTSFLLGALFQASGSLWPPIAAHALVDFMSALHLMRRLHSE